MTFKVRLSVATKIALCFAVVLASFASVGVTSIVSLHRLGHDLAVVGEFYLPLTKALAQLESLHKNKERDTDRVLHEPDRATERLLVSNTRNYFGKMMQERVRGARAVLAHSQELARQQDRPFLDDLDRGLASLSDRYAEYGAAAGSLSDALSVPHSATAPDDATVTRRADELRRLEAQTGHEVSRLSAALEAQVALRVNQVRWAELRAAWAIIALSMGAIALGLLATGLSQRLLLPIRALTEEVRGISRGDFERRVELRSNDEVGLLAQEFNAMAASLGERERLLSSQRERLLRSERLAAIGKVSAQITHEIRNPLSSIGLNAELLADELADAVFPRAEQRAEAQALLSAIAREIDRLTAISEQYLAFARAPRAAAAVDLADLCRDLVDFVRPELLATGVTLDLDLAEELPKVSGSEDQLRQALLNLVRNAHEALGGSASEGGRIVVRAAVQKGEVALEVADTGPGVPAAEAERIFEPFFSTKSTGTGLGLSLCQRIAQEHGGSLRLAPSQNQGSCQGARFVLSLPILRDPVPAGAALSCAPTERQPPPPADPPPFASFHPPASHELSNQQHLS